MILAKAVRKDVTLIVAGLSQENVSRMDAGKPIFKDLADIGLPGYKLYIFTGDSEDVMLQTLRDAGIDTFNLEDQRVQPS